MNNFKIDQKIYNVFGGKNTQIKKVQQKKKKKQQRHMNYLAIELKKIKANDPEIPTDDQKTFECIRIQETKSRDSECDLYSDNDSITDTNSCDSPHYPTSSLDSTFSDLILDTNIMDDLTRESEVESPSTDSPSYGNESADIIGEDNIDLFSKNSEYSDSHEDNTDADINTLECAKSPIIDFFSQNSEYSDSDDDNIDDITPPINYNVFFNLENIGPVGAIHTKDFIEKKKFIENRHKNITEDLMDLIESDSESDYDQNIICTITELLHKFEINKFICYFNGLNITYVQEIINFEPNTIRRGLYTNDITIIINIYKMFKYLYTEIINGNINGNKSESWIELYGDNKNYTYNINQHKSQYLINYEECVKIDDSIDYDPNVILTGITKHTQILNGLPKTNCITLTVIQLPDEHQYSSSLFTYGVNVNDNIISINDRLDIYYNDVYISNIGFGKFVENYSSISFECEIYDNVFQINIKAFQYSETIAFEMNDSCRNGEVFIEQYRGQGEYILDA